MFWKVLTKANPLMRDQRFMPLLIQPLVTAISERSI
jgi:hypothetical protein